jgi:glycosyltransferase involved in cell wall biosynthesis
VIICIKFFLLLFIVLLNIDFANCSQARIDSHLAENFAEKKTFPFDQSLQDTPEGILFKKEHTDGYVAKEQRHIVVVIPSYNNALWYERNLRSVLQQEATYSNFSIVYVDDKSTDGTGNLVSQFIEQNKLQDRIKLIRNTHNQGALANLFTVISQYPPNTTIVTIDGDDWLAHNAVLLMINNIYDKYRVLITYGSYQSYPYNQNLEKYNLPVAQEVINNRSYRTMSGLFTLSHVRTFKAGLFQRVKLEDLKYDGKFFDVSWDLAIMFPMLEMAGDNVIRVPTKSLIYNVATGLNDHKLRRSRQKLFGSIIRSMPKYHELSLEEKALLY